MTDHAQSQTPTPANARLLRAARGEPVDRTPVWLMRQAGRYLPEYREIRAGVPFLQLCKTPDLAAEVTVQPVRRLGVDAAIIFSDILIPVEAMGMALELGDQGPHLPSPLRSEQDIRALRVPDPEETMGFLGEAIRRTRRALSDSVPVIGFCGAPFTIAAYLVQGEGKEGFSAVKKLMYRDPATLHAVQYYQKLPEDIDERLCVVVDPMLATGNSAIAAVERLKELNPKSIKFVCLLTCPEGVAALQKAHPDVPIYTAAIDRELNDHGYILPGLGDAGDRMFGTK